MTDLPVSVPKFNFSKSTIKSDEELKALLDNDGKSGDKYFRPGLHEVTITKMEYKGRAGDQDWGKFVLSFEGAGGKATTGMIFVPFADVNYNGKNGKPTTLFYRRFTKFMDSVGIKVTVANREQVLTETFLKPERSPLIGSPVKIQFGYDGNYVDYKGKDEAGIKKYVIQMANNGGTTAETFPTFDAAAAHAEQANIQLQEYPQVLSYEVSSTPAAKKVSNW